jgi:predicted amidophosphoribosyltransferase
MWRLSMDSGMKIPPIEGKMSVSAPTVPFFSDPRGNRLESWTTRTIVTGHELWLRGPDQVARQVAAADPEYRPYSPDATAGPVWTHALASPRASMLPEVASLLNLLSQILTLPEPPNVDSALCLDWYKIPVAGVDPYQWQNTRTAELVSSGKYRFRYQSSMQNQAGRTLTDILCDVINHDVLLQHANVILDVPGHDSKRYVSFGSRLAEAVAYRRGTPMIRVSSKSEFRPEAKNLNSTQKASILEDEFSVSPGASGKSALIIDDVFQSGSSMAAVAKAARASGVVSIQGLCCVRTMRR